MDKKELILIGGGGHCKACIDVIEQQGRYHIAGIVDRKERVHEKVLGYEIIATDEDIPRLVTQYTYFLITLGQIKSPAKRVQLYTMLVDSRIQFPVIIANDAYVSQHACVGKGTIIMHKACVNAGSVIGEHCIINTAALVEHDAVVGDHCHIATSAVINGNVKVGPRSFVGSNAVTREGVIIGPDAVIGAGTVVTRDISSKDTRGIKQILKIE